MLPPAVSRRCCAGLCRRAATPIASLPPRRRRLLHSQAAIERAPLKADLDFARLMAAGRGSASAEQVSRAAWTAMQVLRLPPLEEEGADDPWAVPLAMLLRSLVEYPRWLVPTSSKVSGVPLYLRHFTPLLLHFYSIYSILLHFFDFTPCYSILLCCSFAWQGQREVLGTLIDPDNQPLLVVCADQANIDLAPSPGADGEIRGVATMPGAELVYRWHTAQARNTKTFAFQRLILGVFPETIVAQMRASEAEEEAAVRDQPVEERNGVLSGCVINPAASGGADGKCTSPRNTAT